ncbi:MAG: radical SAM protein [Bryobacterales bacterium]|nr:radical SAM protein [Bryobacterales bacterium]
MFAKAMASTGHPILAQVIPIRRCNLACAYCNEFDDRSAPVETAEMLRRIDRLAELGTTILTFSGGEPTLHPDLDLLIARGRRHGMLVTLITNGLLLTPERIGRLNNAGLDYLQISIDNVKPDEVSKKSLQVLDKKLVWLAEHADFAVTINSVLGAGIRNPGDAHTIAVRARGLGFGSTVGVIHDGEGQLRPLDPERQGVWERVIGLGGGLFSFAHYDRFQQNITRGLPNDWHCRAGARFLYICEDGLVHYCSQQRGRPGIPLSEYGAAEMARAFGEKKGCAPFCTIGCVHQTAMLDAFREQPRETLAGILERRKAQDPEFEPPWLVTALERAFLRSSQRGWIGRVALRVLGVRR